MIEADYTFYANTYKGTLSEADFNRLLPRASAEIDALTFGRCNATLSAGAQNRVKLAMCAVIDELNATSGGVVASASNDGYSETYAVQRTATQRIKDTAAAYLATTGLMFCGGLPRC